MKRFILNVRFAIYSDDWSDKWWVSNKKVEVSADNLYQAICKAPDVLKISLKNKNPWLDKALESDMIFTDVKLSI